MSNLAALIDSDRINLERIAFLLIAENTQSLDIMGQIVSGFGVRSMMKCESAADAKQVVSRMQIDFILADIGLRDTEGLAFVQWIRREAKPPTRFAPFLIVTAAATLPGVHSTRDAGANYVITKPVSPKILLERIIWVAREDRFFIETDTYAGPDRRFKRLGPPPGMKGRRRDDVNEKLGEAREPNMSQEEINALMKPTKVAI